MQDDIAWVRKIIRKPFWDVVYHEHGLKTSWVKVCFARELVQRASMDINGERADENEDGDPLMRNVTHFALHAYDDAIESHKYHETALAQAYLEVGLAKTLLLRGNYTEISLGDLQKEIDEEARAWEKAKAAADAE
jgi:hypothetical protein